LGITLFCPGLERCEVENLGLSSIGRNEFWTTLGFNIFAAATLGRGGKARENLGEDGTIELPGAIFEISGRRVGILGLVR